MFEKIFRPELAPAEVDRCPLSQKGLGQAFAAPIIILIVFVACFALLNVQTNLLYQLRMENMATSAIRTAGMTLEKERRCVVSKRAFNYAVQTVGIGDSQNYSIRISPYRTDSASIGANEVARDTYALVEITGEARTPLAAVIRINRKYYVPVDPYQSLEGRYDNAECN